MRRIWKHKWIVAGISLVVFLSIGTVALAAGGISATAGDEVATLPSPALVAVAGGPCADLDVETLKERRQAMKEKRDQALERREALMDLLRETMSPEDQATYDRLVEQAKDQRAALEKAREDLQQTAKDLRDLARKYLDAEDGATGTSQQ